MIGVYSFIGVSKNCFYNFGHLFKAVDNRLLTLTTNGNSKDEC